MASIQIKISGSAELIAALQAKMDSIREQVNEAIQGAGINTQAQAKQACPVDTGRLRASIQYEPGILSCMVGTNVNYGPFVELGTCKMAARPFLYPAFLSSSKVLLNELKAITV